MACAAGSKIWWADMRNALVLTSLAAIAGCSVPLSEGKTVTETFSVPQALELTYRNLVDATRACYLQGGMRVEADLLPAARTARVQLVHMNFYAAGEIFRVDLAERSGITSLTLVRRSSHSAVATAVPAWSRAEPTVCPGFGLTNRTP